MDNHAKFIEDLYAEYAERIKTMQRSLADDITKHLSNALDLKGGKMTATAANYSKVYVIDKLYRTFIRDQQIPLFRWFAQKCMSILGVNTDYYAKFAKDEKAALSVAAQVQKEMLLQLGYDGKSFIEGGFLADVANSNDPLKAIKAQAIKAIAQGQSLGDFTQTLRQRIEGTDNTSGLLEAHFRTATNDTFSEFDRSTNLKHADLLGLNYALYTGGKVVSSRPFCVARNNKVFNRKEITAWAALKFQGKPQTGYNPFTQLGGHNCRHVLRWISDEMAKEKGHEDFSTKNILPIKDQEAFAKGNKLANSVLYNGLNPEVAHEINDTLLDFKKLTGQSFDKIRAVTDLKDSVALAVEIKKDGYDLLINAKYFSNFNSIQALNDKILTRYTSEHWQPQDIRGMIAHEFGHLLTLDKTKVLSKTDLLSNILPVSDYAKTNLNETLAEIFAKYYHNGIENLNKSEISLFNQYSKYKI